ncbi:MAG: methyltransferase [Pseudomonadota bacterium]
MTSAPVSAPTASGLGARLRRWRNALLSSPRFQAAAAANPLTRPRARAEAARLFGLCTGFVHSQVLLACVELSVLPRLAARPTLPSELAPGAGLTPEAADRLLKAAAALRLAYRLGDGRYTLGDTGAALLGNPSVLAMIRHHGDFYKDLADPVALLRREGGPTRLAQFWGYGAAGGTGSGAGDAQGYSTLMAQTQAFIADNIMAAHGLGSYRHIMDVGGGAGAFLAAVAKACPAPRLTLCDLPAVADLARETFAAAGLQARAEAVGNNCFTEPLPTGADLITLVRVLHDHDDGPVRDLLAATRQALAPGGRLLVAEPMAATRGAEAMGDSYFGLYLWAMGSGRPRTRAELTAFLKAAGYRRVREANTRQPLLVRVLVADA